MRETQFRRFLEDANQIISKSKAVSSRISRAYVAEEILGCSLDLVVGDDDRMYNALMQIKSDYREKNGNVQNALRWYYRFVNNRSFPSVFTYRCSK